MTLIEKAIYGISKKINSGSTRIDCEVKNTTDFILEGLASNAGKNVGEFLDDVVEGRLLPSGNAQLYYNLFPLVYAAMEGEWEADYRERFKAVFEFVKAFRGLEAYNLGCLRRYYSDRRSLPVTDDFFRHLQMIEKHIHLHIEDGDDLLSPKEIVIEILRHWGVLESIPATYDFLYDLMLMDGDNAEPVSLWTLAEYSDLVYRHCYRFSQLSEGDEKYRA